MEDFWGDKYICDILLESKDIIYHANRVFFIYKMNNKGRFVNYQNFYGGHFVMAK